MAKSRKKPRPLARSDKVHRAGSDAVSIITWISEDGKWADICLDRTELEWFKYPSEELTLIEEQPRKNK
jgi:hypothetical protein